MTTKKTPDRKPAAPPAPDPAAESKSPAPGADAKKPVPEIGGRDGPDPTRYGDWEKGGRCIDF